MWMLALLMGCGSQYRFVVTSPEVDLTEDDVVLYTIDEGDGAASAGGIELVCEDDGECRSLFGDGGDRISDGAEILVWLDVDDDDWDEWTAMEDAEITDLVPDPIDPRDVLRWERHLGVQVLEAELRLP